MKHLKSILFLVIGIAIGISFCKLFSGNSSHIVPSKAVAVNSVTTLEKKVLATEKLFFQKTDSLTMQERILSLQLSFTKSLLEKAKKKNLVLQTQVYGLIDKIALTKTDSSEVSEGCDSLAVKVVALIQNGNEKDSLYEVSAVTQQEQLKNKDSTIALHQHQYQSLKSSFDISQWQQKFLADQNSQYRKQYKRQKLKQKLLSLGVIVLSGLTTNYLLHH
jgi:hypothetical protein